jgi:hypothetical protein
MELVCIVHSDPPEKGVGTRNLGCFVLPLFARSNSWRYCIYRGQSCADDAFSGCSNRVSLAFPDYTIEWGGQRRRKLPGHSKGRPRKSQMVHNGAANLARILCLLLSKIWKQVRTIPIGASKARMNLPCKHSVGHQVVESFPRHWWREI